MPIIHVKIYEDYTHLNTIMPPKAILEAVDDANFTPAIAANGTWRKFNSPIALPALLALNAARIDLWQRRWQIKERLRLDALRGQVIDETAFIAVAQAAQSDALADPANAAVVAGPAIVAVPDTP